MRGTACFSDHRLVRCTASIKLQKLHRLQGRKSVKFNLKKLQDSAVTEAFISDIENGLGQVPSSSDPEEAWTRLKGVSICRSQLASRQETQLSP
jgi:hypothetical protein